MKKSISILVLSVLFSLNANAFQRYSCKATMAKDVYLGPITVGTACDAANSFDFVDFQTSPSSPHYRLRLELTNYGPAEKCQKQLSLAMINLDIRDMINHAVFSLDQDRERENYFTFGYGPTDRFFIDCKQID